jgi:hypothetical protein
LFQATFLRVLIGPFPPYGEATVIESHGRLDLSEARQQFEFDYPESAHDIQFACYYEWIAIEEFVRFAAPVDDCVAFAEATIAQHNEAHPDRPARELCPIAEAGDFPEPARSTALSIAWFNPKAIRQGFAGGNIGSHTPQLWVDTERGIVYYKYTD